ncbi:hypothetical protein WR25_18344 [Diploscapter pachys]|uniref:Uncharacterized protein n=1 Tax=Diploscapter pachys TaxID=2018661 RepID=A0A2A2K3H8_9BILA|nr:hypothetical protein WR25_18344 [Diploscapter pachys]
MSRVPRSVSESAKAFELVKIAVQRGVRHVVAQHDVEGRQVADLVAVAEQCRVLHQPTLGDALQGTALVVVGHHVELHAGAAGRYAQRAGAVAANQCGTCGQYLALLWRIGCLAVLLSPAARTTWVTPSVVFRPAPPVTLPVPCALPEPEPFLSIIDT